MKNVIIVALLLTVCQGFANHPEELGDVNWHRTLNEAIEISEKNDKPILILFQEVPGCATCKNYGNDVLRHPLIVEAIESLFTPLAIYNNHKGADEMVLKKFREPSWNNPVVRIVDSNLEDITTRLSSDYSRLALVQTMTAALIKSGATVPGYLKLLEQEWQSNGKTKTAVYSMYCFWTGEAHFGKLDGVVATEPGFVNGKEVVKVVYDDQIVSRKVLDQYADQASCSKEKDHNGFRMDRTPKYYLSNSKYRMIPMTFQQQTKVNAALSEEQDPHDFLSPGQLQLLEEQNLQSLNLVNISLEKAWKRVVGARP